MCLGRAACEEDQGEAGNGLPVGALLCSAMDLLLDCSSSRLCVSSATAHALSPPGASAAVCGTAARGFCDPGEVQRAGWQIRLGAALVSDFTPKPKLFQAHGMSEMMSLRGRGRGISPTPICHVLLGQLQRGQEPGLTAGTRAPSVDVVSGGSSGNWHRQGGEMLHVSVMVFSR